MVVNEKELRLEDYFTSLEDENYEDEADNVEFDEEIIEADNDGTVIDGSELQNGDEGEKENSGFKVISSPVDFISDTGDIVVMDAKGRSDNFKFAYIDIANIAIVRRIRKNTSVEDLVKSIKSTGLLNPVVVAPTATDGIYVLLDGYRRLLACAKAGIRSVPCVINTKVSTPEIPILEALYNHKKTYSIKEIVDYIEYLEKEKGIMSATLIEYLLQLNSGDYTKLKDILTDNDEEIVNKLFSGAYTIEQAFKKLEQRRKKESEELKELKKAEKVYEEEKEEVIEDIEGAGEEANEEAVLTDEEIAQLAINPANLDEGLENMSLNEMLKKGKETPGYEPHRQKPGEREYIDPAVRKAVLARDNYTCACCKRGGQAFVDALDYHHIIPVYLGGRDSLENGITLCLTDHRLVHLYAVGDLYIPPEKSEEELEKMTEEERILYKDEQMRFKRIIRLGQVIRDAAIRQGIKREKLKKDYPVGNIGRNKPGRIQSRG